MRFKELFLLLLLAFSPFVNAATPCGSDLSLLDKDLRQVLDGISNVYIEYRSAEPSSASAIILQSLLRKKSEALEVLITDPEVLKAARLYISEKVGTLEGLDAQINTEVISLETQGRLEESKFFEPYEALEESTLRVASTDQVRLTPDGILIGQMDGKHIFLKNLLTGDIRKIELSIEVSSASLKYAPLSGELFIGAPNWISAIKVKDLFSQPNIFTPLSDDAEVIEKNNDFNFRVLMEVRRLRKNHFAQGNLFRDFTVSDDGRYLVSAYDSIPRDGQKHEHNALIFDRVRNRFSALAVQTPEERINKMIITPDSKLIAIIADHRTFLHNFQTGAFLREIPIKHGPIAFSPDGLWIAGVEEDGVRLFDVEGLKASETFSFGNRPTEQHIRHIYFSADNSKLIASTEKGQMWIWNVKTKNLESYFDLPGEKPQVSSDGQYLVMRNPLSPNFDRTVTVWKKRL